MIFVKNRKTHIVPEFETLAILDKKKTTPKANVTIPSREAVIDAKEWVEENQK